MTIRSAPALLLLLAAFARPAAAQQAEGPWNTDRALELIRHAQERRTQSLADTGMVDYQADARGYVYFYLDRRDIDERTLVKTDQVALQVFWKAPNQTKQVIVGLRDQKRLPTNIHYHLDHLAVVQDNFGDRIRIGDGDEVADVLHPAAPGADRFYDYRLADSLSIRVPGAGEAVRVYRVEVKPKDAGEHALVGAVYVDRRAGDIVRMEFTFTRSSYVDRELDYINISLENGLWKGRFWLPNRQQVEIRRQLPELGFPAGGVIRGTMTINRYRFNLGLPDWRFNGPRVTMVPDAQARRFAFEQPIDAELRDLGIGPAVELGEIRKQAANLIREHVLSGLPATRLDVPAASTIARYNRAEGLAVGFGVRSNPREQVALDLYGGWAFGPMHPLARADAVLTRPGLRLGASGFVDHPRDVAVGPVISGMMNTLSSALAGRDYSDLFYASGGTLQLERPVLRGWTGTLAARVEDQRSARLETAVSAAGDFRPVHAIDDGMFYGGALSLSHRSPSGRALAWSASVGADGGHLSDRGVHLGPPPTFDFVRPRLDLGLTRRWHQADGRVDLELSAGAAAGTLPRQALYLVGGRGTLPGYEFRAYGGDRFATLRTTASAELWAPFVRGRLLAAAGWADVGGSGRDALSAWGALPMTAPKYGAGAGVGLFYDILRVDVARGLSTGGRWELIIEANPSFWDFL
ncbi:MAG TPA: hypothetical protein VGO40_16370 [Longimicrobium sp.]|nr:hypothetical protein [Longimicrobium sp.]